jgi:DNA-binding NtrC family response regulator
MNTDVARLLVIDEDPHTWLLIHKAFEGEGWEILTEAALEPGLKTFLRVQPKTVLLDVTGNHTGGMELLKSILERDPAANVILTGAQYSADAAIEAIQRGACDYLTKPLDLQKLRERVAALGVEAETRSKTLNLDRELLEACSFEGIVSRSPLMMEVFAKVKRVAPHFRTALVTGATGTGKELVARALHRLSPAARGRFVTCNCSALVESLAESELFGYVKGAFTGAHQDRRGLFESADGGTLFLDEIGELSPGGQAKLLRVLQDRRVRRVGSPAERAVNVRVIAATNRDLRAMTQVGTFREDLYYRLATIEIALPPLKERREDLPLLQRHFISKFATEYGKSIAGITRRAQSRMAAYPWPGNIRELENVLANACMLANGTFIDVDNLPQSLREMQTVGSASDEALFSLEEAQKRHIMRVLEQVGGNKRAAARILKVGRTTIYRILSGLKSGEPSATA